MTNRQMIRRNELLYNGSGYKDITAYKATRKLIGGGNRNMNDYHDGDIVLVKKNNGDECEMLILKCHENYATASILKDFEPQENAVPVISRDKMWLDAGRTGYLFYDAIIEFVKSLSDENLFSVRQQIASALGFNPIVNKPEQEKSTEKDDGILRKEDICHLEDMIQKLTDKAEEKPEIKAADPTDRLNLDKMRTSLIRASAERDVYKELYEQERGLYTQISLTSEGLQASKTD